MNTGGHMLTSIQMTRQTAFQKTFFSYAGVLKICNNKIKYNFSPSQHFFKYEKVNMKKHFKNNCARDIFDLKKAKKGETWNKQNCITEKFYNNFFELPEKLRRSGNTFRVRKEETKDLTLNQTL
jgi:hypothetical protein